MEFDEGAALDTSQIDDERGGGGLLSSLPGGGMAVGGGMGVVGLILALLFGLGSLTGGGGGRPVTGTGTIAGDLAANCQTGADANARTDCRVVGVVDSVQRFWTDEFARQRASYQPAQTRLFTGGIQ